MALFHTYIKNNRVRFAAELAQFCRQRSIASTGDGMQAMAEMVYDRLLALGAVTRTYYVEDSYPFVVGEIGSGPRTLLLYNHYDVQPARYEDGWTYDPFHPVIEHGRLFARGVADNKANLLFRLHAIEAYLAACRSLPIRVRFLIEGEEEIGSPHLTRFVQQHPEVVQADGCLWESGRKNSDGRPLLQLGVRGICYIELSLRAPHREVHSSWSNIAENPAMPLLDRLRQAIDSLMDEAGRPTFGRLLAESRSPSPGDLAMLDAIPFDMAQVQASLGIVPRASINGNKREALRRLLFEPTCTVCGLSVGYAEPGTKTVIPNRAQAKLDFRLPTGLTPDNVVSQLRAHLDASGFADVEIQRLGGLLPSRTDPGAAIVRATSDAVRLVYGVEPILYPSMTASGPMYELCEAQHIPAVTFGTGHVADNVHGTDENIYLDDYFMAMYAMGEIISRFAEA